VTYTLPEGASTNPKCAPSSQPTRPLWIGTDSSQSEFDIASEYGIPDDQIVEKDGLLSYNLTLPCA
jgi:hypothetical protein